MTEEEEKIDDDKILELAQGFMECTIAIQPIHIASIMSAVSTFTARILILHNEKLDDDFHNTFKDTLEICYEDNLKAYRRHQEKGTH